MKNTFCMCLLAIWVMLQAGCTESVAVSTETDSGAEIDVDSVSLDFAPPEIEGHSHDHEIGPNGGHVIKMQPGDAKVEWVQLTEEETVKIFLPELANIESVSMKISLQGGPEQSFALLPDEKSGSGAHMIKSPELMTAMQMKEAVDVSLSVVSGGTTYSTAIEHIGCSCGNH